MRSTLWLEEVAFGALNQMQHNLTGTVQLDLSMSGQLENDGSGKTRRKAGSTTVTGTATSASGVYQVNVTQ